MVPVFHKIHKNCVVRCICSMFSIFRLSALFGPHLDFIPYWPAFIKVIAFRLLPHHASSTLSMEKTKNRYQIMYTSNIIMEDDGFGCK